MTNTLSPEPYPGFTDNLVQACILEDEKRISDLVASWVEEPTLKRRENRPPRLTKEDDILFRAIVLGNLPIIKYFMKRTKHAGPNMNAYTAPYILEAVVESENIQVMDFLMLEYTWEINRPRFRSDASYLGVAARTNNLKLIQWFLDHGADPNASALRGTDETPMSLAATAKVKTMEFMISAGGDVNRGNTLHHAIRQQLREKTGMVKYLLDRGADPNVIEYSQVPSVYNFQLWMMRRGGSIGTPLHTAVACFQFREIETLLQYGADPNINDSHGWTPIQHLRDMETKFCKTLIGIKRRRKDDTTKDKVSSYFEVGLHNMRKTIRIIETYMDIETSSG